MSTPIPRNRAPLAVAEIAAATGGRVVAAQNDRVVGVTTDSRGDVRGKLFVALEGERHDGHDFVADAAARGAGAVLVSREVSVRGTSVVRVGCTTAALGALGRLHRRRWGGRVVAVGGSAGKTTTRAAIASGLEVVAPGAVHATPGNLNNRVGVPMVLLALEDRHRVAVVEIGTNRSGEVAELAAAVEPDVAVLTLIGIEHTEGLGTLDGVESEEGALLRVVPSGGAAVANGDDDRVVRQLGRSPAGTKRTYGTRAGVDYRIVQRRAHGLQGSRLSVEAPARAGRRTVQVDCPLLGAPGALATISALAVAECITGRPVDGEELSTALGEIAQPGRLVPMLLRDGTLVLDDTYNSNPVSVRSSVGVAAEIARERSARLVLILGEMRELGALSVSEHASVGAALEATPVSLLIGVSGDARALVEAAERVVEESHFVGSSAAALEVALSRIEPGDVVLVKASRGVALERVADGIAAAKGRAA